MLPDEPWPDEPDESDPAARWGDPERDLPNVPAAPTPPAESDAPPELMRTFWTVVVLVNVGLLAVSLGPMLAYFRGRWALGGLLVAIGAAALAHAYWIYRRDHVGAQSDANRDGGATDRGGAPDGRTVESSADGSGRSTDEPPDSERQDPDDRGSLDDREPPDRASTDRN